MALRPIGWICGEMVRKFAGQAEIIQRAFLEIIDEIRDEFPNILRLTSSNQQSDRTVQGSGSVVARVFSSAHGAVIMNGLNRLSQSSKSIAKFLQPYLVRKFSELNKVSHRLLKKLNTPKQPLYKMKDRRLFLSDIISYPAQTALTSVMCVSYAALIYLAFSINKIMEKIKNIMQGEKASRESSSDAIDGDEFPSASEATSASAASSTQQVSSGLAVKGPQNSSSSIHILLLALDQENEQ
ncbi:spermatogenesis-associated protein 9 isoform X5 [Hemicordylus capensis]|uniref:spermatogenesis-associated protein 9 isoform X5 n=1 Tax=Hemicordylus capensis TaxID=884348 RepID=UPI0023023AB1|nr:spermatogenesis-associated protein 9 isoform X5 [Hemicordylus capensis]